MPSLPELQREFVDVVLRRGGQPALAGRLEPSRDLARRLGVYRANARENFAAALASAFPVLQARLGAEEFPSLAWSFQRRHPSPSGNLFEVGRALPAFLAARLQGTPDEPLVALATLEWAVQEALTAADCQVRFDPASLAGLAAADHPRLRFDLHPSVRLLELAHPAFEAWRAFQAGEPLPAAACSGAIEHLLVRRAGDGVELQRLAPGEHAALACLAAGGTLADFAAILEAGAGAVDAAEFLARQVTLGVITAAIPPGGLSAP